MCYMLIVMYRNESGKSAFNSLKPGQNSCHLADDFNSQYAELFEDDTSMLTLAS